MAKVQYTISKMPEFSEYERRVKVKVIDALTDCTIDLLSTAQKRAPYKEGTLEQNGAKKVNTNTMVGEVSFRAINRGFNYARQMDTKKYNLGKQSKRKSPAKSKFCSGSLPVGTGFLTDTAKRCANGYQEHINDAVDDVTRKFNNGG